MRPRVRSALKSLDNASVVWFTVKNLNIGTSEIIAVIILKLKKLVLAYNNASQTPKKMSKD